MDLSEQKTNNFSSENIESAINKALLSCIKKLDVSELLVIKYKLIELLNKEYSKLLTYWLSYTCENIAIFYGQIKEIDKEESEIKEGIKLLENIEDKSAESLALLSMMDGYAIKYIPPFRMVKHMEKCKTYAKDALKLQDKNPRAFLSLGIFEFFTHETYGGGKKTPEYLKKAIEYKDEKEPGNPIIPKWGTNIAYEFLVKYYIKNKDNESSEKYLEEGLALMPEDRNLNKIKKQFITQ